MDVRKSSGRTGYVHLVFLRRLCLTRLFRVMCRGRRVAGLGGGT